jgi:cytochrome c oxidase subunit IV
MSHSHGTPAARGHAGHDAHADHSHDAAHIKAHVRKYMMVFGALLVGTVITVAMYYVYLPSVALTVVVALFIATIKASLVACYFMHLIDERKMIYTLLFASAFFFAGMMALILFSYANPPSGTLLPAYQGK